MTKETNNLQEISRNIIINTILGEDETSLEKQNAEETARRIAIENKGREDYFALRKKWSFWIILWISILIGFNILLTACIGFDLLNFKDYKWFITTVTVETFIQIVGMGYIAVRYLFSPSQ